MSYENGESLEGVLNQWIKLPRLHRLLPYESYDPTTRLFFNQGSTGFVFLASPLAGIDIEDQKKIAQFFRQESNLPEGTSIQFLLFASPYIGPHMAYWRKERKGPIYSKLASRRSEFLEKKAFEDSQGLLIRDYRLIISYTVPGHITSITEQQNLMGVRKEFRSVLDSMGIYTEELDASGLINEVGNILNIEEKTWPNKREWNEFDSINKQIIDSHKNYSIIDNGLYLNDGKTLCRSYIPKSSPKYWPLYQMSALLGNMIGCRQRIPCPFIMHCGLFVDNFQKKSKLKFYANRESLEKGLKNGFSKYDPTMKEKYEEIDQLCEELKRGERIVVSSLSTTLFSKPEMIQENEQQLKGIFQGCDWEFEPTRYDHLPFLLSCLPMTWTLGQTKKGFDTKVFGCATALEQLGRAKKTITKVVQNTLPIVAEWKGQSSPGVPLVGATGQLFFLSPFGKMLLPGSDGQTHHDFNMSISGAPGAGKSALMNEVMTSTMGIGGKSFVLDYGRSFKNSCIIQGGQYIDFDIRHPICLNPFSKVPEGNTGEALKDREEMLSIISPIIQVMAAPINGTTDLQNSYIDQAVRTSWENYGSRSSIDTVRKILMLRDEKEAKDLGQSLFSFSSEGPYGHFFNKEANASFENSLVVIETDHLRNYPSLMSVIIQMLILQVNQIMATGDRKTPFLIMIDEAWKLLSGQGTASFISGVCRTTRKYRGGLVTATQNLTDFFRKESPGATEAFNCSAWKIIMQQGDDVITSLKHHEQLSSFVDTEYKESLLRSIRSQPPYYSEMAIFGPEVNGALGRLRLDPFSRLLYSTNAEEFRRINEYIKEGDSTEIAIEKLIAMQEGRIVV